MTSLAARITAACLLVAVVAVGAAGLVAVRLVAVTARTVTQDVLAQQADVVAAQLADRPAAGCAAGAGCAGSSDVLAGQGVDIVVVTARGARNPGRSRAGAPAGGRRPGARRATGVGEVVSGGVRYLVEARPAPVGGFALVRTSDTGPLGDGLVRRNLTWRCWPAWRSPWSSVSWSGSCWPARCAAPRPPPTSCARGGGTSGCRSPGPTEVAAVAGAVNELADALAHSEERQRLFLLSVSHELRTPLTAVRGFAESLADGVVTGDDAPTPAA